MQRLAILAGVALLGIATAACGPSEPVSGTGKVNAVMAEERKINVSHEPIPALDWPEMTMDFRLAESATIEGIDVGDTITFRLRKAADGSWEIESLSPSKD